MEKKKYPVGAEHYVLYEEVGQGVSASVFRAKCIPNNEIVAIKILDFERGNSDLNNISREAQTMILVDHPNVLKSHCSFVNDHNLWVVMPFMPGGSCLHILKSAHPDGFEEVVIATILREVLKALEYLHDHGLIHRDVKAGNILISENGAIKLGDLGVSACLFDSGDRQRTRNTFVGTPCWMAPEVMEQLHGYDFKADIWSFGITALELAHGHAPFSKYPPMKVLLMTLQNAPPGLDYERDKKFSKSFKQMIASCLVKDPSKRPSAKKLLKHSFFRQAKSNEFIARKLLEGLPAIGDRLQALKKKEEDMLVQKKIPDGKKEEISQNEYKRGISCWNFDLEDMKAQASLDEESVSDKDHLGNSNTLNGICASGSGLPPTDAGSAPVVDSNASSSVGKCESNGHMSVKNSSSHAANCNKNDFAGKHNWDISRKSVDGVGSHSHQEEPSSRCVSVDDSKLQGEIHVVSRPNGSHSQPMADTVTSESISKPSKTTLTSDDQDEESKCQVVQRKGRFKVTSENADTNKVASSPVLLKSPSMRLQVTIEHPAGPQPSQGDSTAVQTTQQANNLQGDGILSSTKQLSTGKSIANNSTDTGSTAGNITGLEKSKVDASDDREKELLNEISDLHRRLLCAQEELQKYKAGNCQNE
ncbi:serine/threonine-protein kinase OSR1 isoform X3 [Helianthus annuus]|uniref:serine/threonine-protein kinase OSR1 isoform X3 n=1 Tax=Helianthus annuus TaxID=4232 RepID=UPI000B906307|nr:serine/threonine-protein kinase OSR1 isoform X3 [Helianthus annuus]